MLSLVWYRLYGIPSTSLIWGCTNALSHAFHPHPPPLDQFPKCNITPRRVYYLCNITPRRVYYSCNRYAQHASKQSETQDNRLNPTGNIEELHLWILCLHQQHRVVCTSRHITQDHPRRCTTLSPSATLPSISKPPNLVFHSTVEWWRAMPSHHRHHHNQTHTLLCFTENFRHHFTIQINTASHGWGLRAMQTKLLDLKSVGDV